MHDQSIKNPPRAVVISARGQDSFESRQLDQLNEVLSAAHHARLAPMTPDAFTELCIDADIVAMTRRGVHDLDSTILERLPALRAVSIYATGFEWLDAEAMARRDISLHIAAGYSTRVVAEHALAMMLAMARRVHLSNDRCRGHCPDSVSLRGGELHGKTAGIVGYGRIGRCLADMLRALGLDVTFADPAVDEPAADKRALDGLLRESDHIILCACHVRNAPPIIGKQELSLCAPHAYLINPSRPHLVDHRAVVDALEQRALAGYALDDCLPELHEAEKRLDFGRILQTGHTAWYSNEAMARGLQEWVDNTVAAARMLETIRS